MGKAVGIDLGIEQGAFLGDKVRKLAQDCGESRSGRRHGALEMSQICPEKKGAHQKRVPTKKGCPPKKGATKKF